MAMETPSYRTLLAWQHAMDLAIECYELTKRFPRSETSGLISQLQRAAVSVPSNMAEGRARQHGGEFVRHISIANGSLARVETLTQIAARLRYISEQQADELFGKTAEIGHMLNTLRNSIPVGMARKRERCGRFV
jgi:four helix bundle protein